MTVRYRRDIKRHYRAFIEDGMRRYADHRAMKAAVHLASQLLSGALNEAAAARSAFSRATEQARVMQMLADHGVRPEALLARVAEVVAFIDDHPGRLPNTRAEDHAMARAVLTLVSWKVRFCPGAKMLRFTGELLREYLAPWALQFTRRLRQDIERQGALVRESATWDKPDTTQALP